LISKFIRFLGFIWYYYIVDSILAIAIGLVPILLALAIFHIVRRRGSDEKMTKSHLFGSLAFCGALVAVLVVTGIPSVFEMRLEPDMNFVPFIDIVKVTFQYFLNVMLFVPFGFLLPMLWRQFERWHVTVLCGFALSLFIELAQLFSFRVTDIDDLIMNTLGSAVGYFLFRLVRRFFPKISAASVERRGAWRWEPWLCLGGAIVSMMVIAPWIFR